jgi:hypothetical protein
VIDTALLVATGGRATQLPVRALGMDRWDHLVVVHSRSRLPLESKTNANVGHRMGARRRTRCQALNPAGGRAGQLAVYVNGHLAATAQVPYPAAAPLSSLRFCVNARYVCRRVCGGPPNPH